MLIACEACHRQYDVGTLEPGAKVRCFCGALNTVPEQRAHDVEMLHCNACGGNVERGAKTCEYCDRELQLADRGLGEACPSCYARLVKGARFCSGCGTEINPQTISKLPTNHSCPRCSAALSRCEIPGGDFTECTGCGGIWLEEGLFTQATEQQEQSTLARFFATGPNPETVTEVRRSTERLVKYLNCPVCGEIMHRKNFATCSGVIIDWCKGHGYWFDTHELELILQFVAKGGLEKARKREIQNQKHEARLARQHAHAMRLMSRGNRGGADPFATPPGPVQGGVVGLLSALVRGLLR